MRRRELLELIGISAVNPILSESAAAQELAQAAALREQLFDAEQILAIDCHCHLFNATDLQVDGFIQRVALRDSGPLGRFAARFGPYIQKLGWEIAPDASDELALYDRIGPNMPRSDDAIAAAARDQYQRTRAALIAEAQATEQRLIDSPGVLPPAERELQMETAQSLQSDLDENYDDFLARVDSEEAEAHALGVGFFSLLGFLISQFQYRLTSYRRYLRRYNRSDSVKMDMLTPSLVDFDYWLARGRPTQSTLEQQIEVMTQLAKIAEGTVHAFVPFDPFREVMSRAGGGVRSSLSLVQSALESGGFIGVKLYPPMGFAPFGNEGHDEIWAAKDWLPSAAHEPGFGKRLDEALTDLYSYCIANGVPVMAHSNVSNAAHASYDQLLHFDYWQRAVEEHKGLKLNLGHFGGAGSASGYDEARVRQFARLMLTNEGLYADSSYFGELLEDRRAMRRRLRRIVRETPELAGRLVYGSDWKMLALERGSRRYLDRMIDLADDVELDAEAFFGRNAARYLGLDGSTRTRLEQFYDREGMTSDPIWMTKPI